MLSLFSQATPASAEKSRKSKSRGSLAKKQALLLHSFTAPFRNRNLGWKCLKCQLCPGTSSRTSRPSWPLLPSFEPRVAPFFRAKDKPQTGTVKLFDKALCKLAGMKDTALSAYLHRKATAWYKRFPPIHSPESRPQIAPRTPRRPRLTVAMGLGVRPRTRLRRMSRSALWRPSLHRMVLTTRAGNEARSAQLFLLLSDIAWYIAGAGCYIPPFISGVLYS